MAKPCFSDMIVTNLCAAGRVNFHNLTICNQVNRSFNAIYLKLSGYTTYESGGVTHVSDPNHIVFLPKGSCYTVNFRELGECFRLEFDSRQEDSDIISIPIRHSSTFLNGMLKMENLWLFKKPGYLPRCMSILYSMLAQMDELTNSAYTPSSKMQLIEGALAHLEANYADAELAIGDLAQAAGISEVYFRRLFSEVYHTSPSRYLRHVRIERAKDLLTGDFSSIDEIAHLVGFSTIYHFSKSFRQITGQTPSGFAQAVRLGNAYLESD